MTPAFDQPLGSATEPTPADVPELNTLIWERFMRLLEIKRRLHALRAFVDELTHVTRGKRFRIRNEIVWHAMLDVRDKLVIDLYSLTVEMRHGMKARYPDARPPSKTKRGLFIEIRDHHCATLSRIYRPHPDDDQHEIARFTKMKAELFARLFPSCATDSPTPGDIERLCEEFRRIMVPLGADRNKNRAHAQEGDFGQVKMLSVSELAVLFKYFEELLESLSLLGSLSSFGGDNMNHADCNETAADLADQVLFGNIVDVTRLMATGARENLYARLHAIDDAAQTEVGDKLHFNDRQFGPPFEDSVAMVAGDTRAARTQRG